MIGIGGLGRSGKDTLAECLAKIISEELNVEVRTFSFADEIKKQSDSFLKENYNISAFTEKTEEKNIIRDFLVCHGETMKSIYGKTIWANIVIKSIKESGKKIFPIIPDVRFDFETEAIKKEDGAIIHINKIGNQPPNEIELKNDPLVAESADIKHSWPVYEPNQMHECMGHAHILWEMLKDSNLEIWKKIYC